ncbi:MAG: PEGA domain-containing protein [Candidatus Sumerlaeaceae bacterium]|nr:PEGA domain-containing protein [Candidatus Sumerlaeaceae bacterium]
MRLTKSVLFVTMLGLILAAGSTVWGQSQRGLVAGDLPSFDAWVNMNARNYDVGERARVSFSVTEDAYVFIFVRDPRGEERQIFPNFYEQNNYVRRNERRTIPGGNYQLMVTGPPGPNVVTLVAVKRNQSWFGEYKRFSSSNPYPSISGGATALANRARTAESSGASKRGLVAGPIPAADNVATASVEYRVYGGGGGGGYRRGSLDVVTSPNGATVTLNGEYMGRTPLERDDLAAGTYRIKVERRGYWDMERSLTIEAGQKRKVRINMQPAPERD